MAGKAVQCFGIAGDLYPDFVQCPGSSACCRSHDACLANRLCRYNDRDEPSNIFYRGPCSSMSWQPEICAAICLYSGTPNRPPQYEPRITQCSDRTFCCDTDQKCCEQGRGHILNANGNEIGAMGLTTVRHISISSFISAARTKEVAVPSEFSTALKFAHKAPVARSKIGSGNWTYTATLPTFVTSTRTAMSRIISVSVDNISLHSVSSISTSTSGKSLSGWAESMTLPLAKPRDSSSSRLTSQITAESSISTSQKITSTPPSLSQTPTPPTGPVAPTTLPNPPTPPTPPMASTPPTPPRPLTQLSINSPNSAVLTTFSSALSSPVRKVVMHNNGGELTEQPQAPVSQKSPPPPELPSSTHSVLQPVESTPSSTVQTTAIPAPTSSLSLISTLTFTSLLPGQTTINHPKTTEVGSSTERAANASSYVFGVLTSIIPSLETNPPSSSDDKLAPGAKVAIGIIVLLATFAIAASGFFLWRRKIKRQEESIKFAVMPGEERSNKRDTTFSFLSGISRKRESRSENLHNEHIKAMENVI
ncbi:hypothetical protein HYALB_00013817 [Hymenoscyphus albidus]|uniref:Uncharacterized protein n=1 Tax=Hymenoscyphus albidus TaxID=595503 RepID=A0A9N9LWL9_9HELO|nr:hypothetical protein HYALB_00013817 [Hymenoscyphus albidus]